MILSLFSKIIPSTLLCLLQPSIHKIRIFLCCTCVALVSHLCCSCCTFVAFVLLVSHSCCTRVARAALMLHLCCSFCTCVTSVALELLVSGTRVVKWTRSSLSTNSSSLQDKNNRKTQNYTQVLHILLDK